MNTLIPHTWLLEHLETAATPKDIQRELSLAGPSVERIYDRDGESVYDIEITTNRVDALSVRGLAREAAVILKHAGFPARLKPLSVGKLMSERQPKHLPTIDLDASLCKRLTCVLLRNVERRPTPDWMAKRLTAIEVQVHDAAVDITNYVTHEIGHPCHAFDADKLAALGNVIRVTEAATGESFTTLDGKTFTTVGGEVVFVNGEGTVIDLPGIMGTSNSSVDDSTRNIVLLAESVLPKKIRFASMTHAIRTQAAQMNEKGVDPTLIEPTLLRAVELYENLTGAQAVWPALDQYPRPARPATIVVPKKEIRRYLGVTLRKEHVASILRELGCVVTSDTQGWRITPPTWRPDLTIPADIVEEVVRIHGYQRIPSELMATPIPVERQSGVDFAREEQVVQLLADAGYQELYTVSMVDDATARAERTDTHLMLRNPLTSDNTTLRTALLPSHIQLWPKDQRGLGVRGTFELANVYVPRNNDLPDEHLHLALTDTDLRSLRATLDQVLQRLFIRPVRVTYEENTKEKPWYTGVFARSPAIITHNDRVLGWLGQLPNGQFGAELVWRELLASARRYPEYKAPWPTAPYYEDITLALKPRTPASLVLETLHAADPLVRAVAFLDQFGQRMTFRLTYQDRQEQVDSTRAAKIRENVLAAVADLIE